MVDSPSAVVDTPAPAGTDGSEAATAAFSKMLASEHTPPETPTASPAEVESAPAPDDEPLDVVDEVASDDPDDDPDGPAADGELAYVVPGHAEPIPVSELIKGYTRHADYTRKSMANAEERKALEAARGDFEAKAKALDGTREEYVGRLQQLAEAMRESQGEPDWEALQAADPIEFATQYARWQVKQQRRQAVEAEQARVRAANEERQQAELARRIETETTKLYEAFPEWKKDPAKATADGARIRTYAESLGFTAQDLAPAQQDHRLVRLLHDAARFRDLEQRVKQAPIPATKAAPVAAKATAPKPGNRPPVSDLTRQRQRLAKTGSDTDMDPIFLALINAEQASKRR